MLRFHRAIATSLSLGLFPPSDSNRLASLKMGTEPIQNLAIATSLSLLISLSLTVETDLVKNIDIHRKYNDTHWSDVIIAIALWKRAITLVTVLVRYIKYSINPRDLLTFPPVQDLWNYICYCLIQCYYALNRVLNWSNIQIWTRIEILVQIFEVCKIDMPKKSF